VTVGQVLWRTDTKLVTRSGRARKGLSEKGWGGGGGGERGTVQVKASDKRGVGDFTFWGSSLTDTTKKQSEMKISPSSLKEKKLQMGANGKKEKKL